MVRASDTDASRSVVPNAATLAKAVGEASTPSRPCMGTLLSRLLRAEAEAERVDLPLRPVLGDEYHAAVLGTEGRLRETWKRRPWRNQ